MEAPYCFFWNHIPFYQAVHGRTSLSGFVAPPSTRRPDEIPLGSRKVRLAHGVHVGDPARLRELKIDMVVFHKRLDQEFPGPYTLTPVDVRPWIALYRRRYGEPVFEDSTLAVFQLRR